MSLQTIPVPSMHNGVSQQAASVRAADQGELQVNAWSSLADGLQKRAPTAHIAKLLGTSSLTGYLHEINRDEDERYVVVFAGGQLRVFTLNGEERTVTAPGGWGYLSTISDPAKDLSMTTVADYTFVINRNVVPAMAT